ncbi:tRNA lysidine(34) synthetase TilS [Acidicapsa dinghuensis]|uniref:tRNA(Ile)-lysidine synthase n=1 Tax=Acidicapsa dinghuensis TaxID=2218256 RepID=A0ABW1EJJ9_9BACT|nr:tRNA lysidine(34) synthetase TilS [Acidicapsa dinghuensis]
MPIDRSLLKPGLRLAVGLSGGADSVALTLTLAGLTAELGLVLHLAHLHHGLRGTEADEDQRFCAELAERLEVPFFTHRVDAAAEAKMQGESIEEAARRLRYGWFRELMAGHRLDAVATAHTLDDQAETVLGKFLRGAWTEGLSGIFPSVAFAEGRILRPFLTVSRSDIEVYLQSEGQEWREDSSNRDVAFTRNRLRHDLLPDLERWNPQIKGHLAGMAMIARDEEEYWETELARLAPQVMLSGLPVRGGGRDNSGEEVLALDVVRLAGIEIAAQRRLIRYAAERLGVVLDFEATESVRRMAAEGRAGNKLTLTAGLRAERTPREIRFSRSAGGTPDLPMTVELCVPGEAEVFGWRFRVEGKAGTNVVVRNWKPGDKVTLRYSSGRRKVKEVLERLKVTGEARSIWPVVEWMGQLVWMQGVEVQPVDGVVIRAEKLS